MGTSSESEQGWPSHFTDEKMEVQKDRDSHSKWALGRALSECPPFTRGGLCSGKQLVSPCRVHAQVPLPPPGPAAAGWRRAADAHWQGCCTVALGHSPAVPGGMWAARWAPTQGGGTGQVSGASTQAWCPSSPSHGAACILPGTQGGVVPRAMAHPTGSSAKATVRPPSRSPHPCPLPQHDCEPSGLWAQTSVVWKTPLPTT